MTKNRDISKILDQNTTFTASLSVGSGTANVFANSTILKLANSTVNTALRVPTTTEYAGSYYLHANGTWQLVAAGATPGGANTQVQFNDSTALGGTAGLTFNKDTNNVLIANTLTVGASGNTINSTVWTGKALTANDSTNLGGTAAASYQLNSTLAANVATMTANNATWHGTSVFANSTGAYPTSNSVGAVLGNTISRVIITGNSATFTSTLAAGDTTITGFVNATVSVNSAAHTTTGFLANATHVVPTSNSSGQTLGNTISRWVITANSVTVSGGASPDSNTLGTALGTTTQRWVALANTVTVSGGVSPDSNTLGTALGTTTQRWVITGNSATFTSTLAAGDTTITGFVNATVSVNSALFTTTGFRANTIGVYPTSNSSGQLFGNTISRWAIFANTIDVTTSITANGALGTGSQILTSNSLGGVYWASPSGGGNVTKVGTPVDDQVGVWTGDGTIEGTTGFTFSAASNNAVIANTLTVGTATVNSTLANVSALNVINQTNTATLFVTTSANVGTAVLANSIGLTTTGFVNAATVVNSASHTIGSTLIANTLGVYHTGIVNAASHTTTGFLANATHVVPTSNSSGQTFGNTISRWVMTANSLTVSGGASPDSNTLGTALGTTTQRWLLLANTIESTGLANVSALNVVAATNTATLFATTSAAVGANVVANTTAVLVGNSTTNVIVGNNIISIGNSTANVVANSIAVDVSNSTANVIITPVSFFAGNSVANLNANSIQIKLANSTSNTTLAIPSAADWAGNKFLHANGTWVTPSASATAGGPNTAVQFNDSTAIAGNAAFTFDKATNTVFFANTLTSGNSTINLVANSTTLLLSNSSTETITANSAALAIGNSSVNNTLNSVSIAINISPTANLTSNSVLVQVANASGTANLTPIALTVGTSVVNSTVISTGAGQYMNATSIKVSNTGLITATSTAANGYTYLPGGILMQWGWVLANTGTGNATFPIAFPAVCASVTTTSVNAIANTTEFTRRAVIVASPNTTVAQIRTSNATVATNVAYIAVGY